MGKVTRGSFTDSRYLEWDDRRGRIYGQDSIPETVLAFLRENFLVTESRDHDEIEIEVRIDWYDDPGCTYGDPDRCYPPESGEERDIVAIHGLSRGKRVSTIPWKDVVKDHPEVLDWFEGLIEVGKWEPEDPGAAEEEDVHEYNPDDEIDRKRYLDA